MNPKLVQIYEKLKEDGLTDEQEQKILAELDDDGSDDLPYAASGGEGDIGPDSKQIYSYNDLFDLQAIAALQTTHSTSLRSIDELLERVLQACSHFTWPIGTEGDGNGFETRPVVLFE